MEKRLGNTLADHESLRAIEHVRALSLRFPFALNRFSIPLNGRIRTRRSRFSTDCSLLNKNNNLKRFLLFEGIPCIA